MTPFNLSARDAEKINLNDPEQLDRELEIMEMNLARQNRSPYYRVIPTSAKAACFCLTFSLSVGMAIFFIVSSSTGNSPSNKEPFVLPRSSVELVSKCNMTTPGNSIKGCEKLCEVADCCKLPANFAYSCLAGNENRCMEYHASCHILNDATGPSPVEVEIPLSIPQAPQNLNELCNSSDLTDGHGFQLCSEACLKAQCCYDEDVTPSCTNHHQECLGYAPCFTLSAAGRVHPDIQIEVEKKCSESKVQSDSGWSACESVCSHAVCCFPDSANSARDGDDPCSNHDNVDLWCSQYETCQNIMLGDDDAPDSEATLDPVEIDNEKIPDDGTDDGSYFIPDSTNPNLNDGSYFIPDSTNPNLNAESLARARACHEYTPQNPNLECEEMCKPGLCCFPESGIDCNDASMGIPDGMDCRDYSPCYIAIMVAATDGNYNNSVDTQAIQVACGAAEHGDGKSNCAALCEPGTCCFDKDGCDETKYDMDHCPAYSSCYILFGDTMEQMPATALGDTMEQMPASAQVKDNDGNSFVNDERFSDDFISSTEIPEVPNYVKEDLVDNSIADTTNPIDPVDYEIDFEAPIGTDESENDDGSYFISKDNASTEKEGGSYLIQSSTEPSDNDDGSYFIRN